MPSLIGNAISVQKVPEILIFLICCWLREREVSGLFCCKHSDDQRCNPFSHWAHRASTWLVRLRSCSNAAVFPEDSYCWVFHHCIRQIQRNIRLLSLGITQLPKYLDHFGIWRMEVTWRTFSYWFGLMQCKLVDVLAFIKQFYLGFWYNRISFNA